MTFALFAGGCTPAATSTPGGCDLAAYRAVASARASGSEVTVCGRVERVGRLRHSRSGDHRSFVVAIDERDHIEVDANIDVLGEIPLRTGERAEVRGEYYADPGGRSGIHWTHRTSHGAHPPGYVILDGTLYR